MNEDLLRVPESYLFQEIGDRVETHKAEHPNANIIKLGIGDAVLPLAPCVIQAGKRCLDEMGVEASFAGYPESAGDPRLREAISRVIYDGKVAADHIFVSTGAKEDTGSFQELFGRDVQVMVTDPVYPVYVNTNLMGGRHAIVMLPSNAENGFLPEIPDWEGEAIIYLCLPNNPTGQVASREYLEAWVDYAARTDSTILFDAAYNAFIREDDVPRSIFEIEGAQEVAVEFNSLSKSHGFTGQRVAYTAIGRGVELTDSTGQTYSVRERWAKRQSYRTNGVAHVLQAMALAALSEEGMKSSREQTDYYLENADMIREILILLGLKSVGGVNSPYLWVQTPDGQGSWDFFDRLLKECGIVCTPGKGFGDTGEGYFRLSAFAFRRNVEEAVHRLEKLEV